MSISGVNNYNSYSNTYADFLKPKANESSESSAKKTDNAKSQESDIKNQSVSEYYNDLRKRYAAVEDNKVSIAGEYMKQASSDPATAKELEDFLRKVPDIEKDLHDRISSMIKAAGGNVSKIETSFQVTNEGHLIATVSSVSSPGKSNSDSDEIKEKIEKRLKERREKLEEEKKLREEKLAERKQREEEIAERIQEEEILSLQLKGNRLYEQMEINYVG